MQHGFECVLKGEDRTRQTCLAGPPSGSTLGGVLEPKLELDLRRSCSLTLHIRAQYTPYQAIQPSGHCFCLYNQEADLSDAVITRAPRAETHLRTARDAP